MWLVLSLPSGAVSEPVLAGALQLDRVMHSNIVPQLQAKLTGNCATAALPQLRHWLDLYQAAVKHQGGKTARIALGQRLPYNSTSRALQRIAVQWLLAHEAVSVVLVGSRTEEYVAQLSALAQPRVACWPPRVPPSSASSI